MKFMPGCCHCTPSCGTLTVNVAGCDSGFEVGASVTLNKMVFGSPVFVGSCTTDAAGQCTIPFPTSGSHQIVMVGSFYSRTVGISLTCTNTTLNILPPTCEECTTPWATTLTLHTPDGDITLTKVVGATNTWNGSGPAAAEGVDCEDIEELCRCGSATVGTISVTVVYTLKCSFVNHAICLQRVHPICGLYIQAFGCTGVPPGDFESTTPLALHAPCATYLNNISVAQEDCIDLECVNCAALTGLEFTLPNLGTEGTSAFTVDL